jgi:CHAT domain-containing protein
LTQAHARLRAGDPAGAWAFAEQALPSASTIGEHELYAEIAREAGRLPDAVAKLRERARGHGQQAAASEATLGLIRMWQGDYRTAITHSERAVSLGPDELLPYLTIVESQLALGDRTFHRLDALRARVGYHWAELTARAALFDATGRTPEALPLYEAALRAAPGEPEILRRRAQAEARLGRFADAEATLDRAVKLVRAVHPDRRAAGEEARALSAIEITRAESAFLGSRLDRAQLAAAAARTYAETAGDRAALAAALALSARIQAERDPSAAARRMAAQALQIARRLDERRIERAALEALAFIDLQHFETRSAREQLKTALSRAAETGDSRGIESTLTLLGLTQTARGEYLEALTTFNEAAARAADAGNAFGQEQAIDGASRANLLLSNHWQALDLAVHAQALAEEIGCDAGVGQASLTAGRAALELGLYDRSEAYLQRAAEVGSRLGLTRLEGRALLDLGRVAENLGQADVASAWYERALTLAQRAGDPALEADGVSAIGEGFFELGAYGEALHQYERALAMATEAGYLEGRLRNLTRAGETLKLIGDTRRSIALFQESLRLSQGLKNRVSQATSYSQLGEIYATLGEGNRSLTFLNRALKVNRETGSAVGEGQSLLALCRAYRLAENPSAATDYCAQALNFAESHGHEAERARASIELGNAYLDLGQLDRAAGYFQAGRELAHELDRPNIQWPAAAGMARVLAAQGHTEPAVEMGREAVATLERLRSQLDLPEMRAGFLEDKLDPYEQLVLLLARQGLLAEAFRTMEYSRSRTFLEVLADAPGNAGSERVAALRRKIYDMRREILDRTEDLAALPASADRDSATTAVLGVLNQLRKQHDALQAEMRRELPDESAASGAEPLALDAVQAMLSSSEALLEYYVTRNDLLIFLITNDGVRALIQPQSEVQLGARVKLYQAAVSRDPVTGGGAERWLAPATALTQVLIDPVRRDPLLAGREQLIVVPHRFLNLVPFQALLGRRASAGEPQRYLIEDYAVSYAPSASILKHCRDHAHGRRLTALALANPAPMLPGGTELMYAADEVAAVKRLFGDQASVGVGQEATETRVKGAAGNVDLLHLATHYAVDERDPMRSALDFAPSATDDGRLEVREVMGLGVGADLVVVSGCSTANGEIAGECPAGDDWVGLTRAFLHAGAPSVLGTLWPVNDRSSARFMDRFYDFLPAAGKGGAVAAAQRDMLAGRIRGGADLQDPYFWAPFVLIGAAN